MTLAELITHLTSVRDNFPDLAHLPVYLGDWNEEYADDLELQPSHIQVEDPPGRSMFVLTEGAPAGVGTYRVVRNEGKPRRIRIG